MIEALKADLIRDEGRKESAYQDHMGFWTIGIGHLIDERKGGKLPPHIIDALLDHDIATAQAQLDDKVAWWKSRPESVQLALVQMVFQLGIGGLLKFQKMLSALHAGDYATARKEALDSAWAKQTPERAARVTALFTGE